MDPTHSSVTSMGSVRYDLLSLAEGQCGDIHPQRRTGQRQYVPSFLVASAPRASAPRAPAPRAPAPRAPQAQARVSDCA